METALLFFFIAGAILLAILLVSLGIMVYNNAKGTVSDANLDSEEAQTFNTKISQYCGTRKSATDMNSLMDAISASNGAQNAVSASERKYIGVDAKDTNMASYVTGTTEITVTGAGTASAALSSTQYPVFDTGITYTASYTTDADGYINKVTVTKMN